MDPQRLRIHPLGNAATNTVQALMTNTNGAKAIFHQLVVAIMNTDTAMDLQQSTLQYGIRFTPNQGNTQCSTSH